MKKLLAFAALCLLAECSSTFQPVPLNSGKGGGGDFSPLDTRDSVGPDYHFIGRMGGP